MIQAREYRQRPATCAGERRIPGPACYLPISGPQAGRQVDNLPWFSGLQTSMMGSNGSQPSPPRAAPFAIFV